MQYSCVSPKSSTGNPILLTIYVTSLMQTLVLTCMIWFFPDPLALPTEYMDLLNLCIRSTNFQYNSKLYEQLQDTVIRFSLSAVVAEIVKQNIEESALSTRRQSIPLSLRYVDETPPQDTTKSTHSTTTLTEKTLTHNSLPEDMV